MSLLISIDTTQKERDRQDCIVVTSWALDRLRVPACGRVDLILYKLWINSSDALTALKILHSLHFNNNFLLYQFFWIPGHCQEPNCEGVIHEGKTTNGTRILIHNVSGLISIVYTDCLLFLKSKQINKKYSSVLEGSGGGAAAAVKETCSPIRVIRVHLARPERLPGAVALRLD